MPCQLIDHTADIGIRVWAAELPELFSEAARAMLEQIRDASAVAEKMKRKIEVDGIDRTDLLINWLKEILFLYSGEGFLIRETLVESITDTRICGQVSGEPLDLRRHLIRREIKAVTYHGADIRKGPDGWETLIIFDV